MKNFNPLIPFGAALTASLLFFSCQKQIEKTTSNESLSSTQSIATTDCKPAFLGVYAASGAWNTLAQKWYSSGRVKYLKAKSGAYAGTFNDPYLELLFDLNWGEVSYQGNQVYVTDVLNNRPYLRVTLDNFGRPAASYFYNQNPPGIAYWNDTTYYYYNGDQLDYVISLYQTNSYGAPLSGFRKFSFSYDSYGDLARVERNDGSVTTFQYDYSKPITGIISDFQVTSSLKLVEYLELMQLPMHFALTRIDVQPFGISYVYKNHVMTDQLVQSYEYDDVFKNHYTFYNAWDCGATPTLNATSNPGKGISNLKEFREVYPGRN